MTSCCDHCNEARNWLVRFRFYSTVWPPRASANEPRDPGDRVDNVWLGRRREVWGGILGRGAESERGIREEKLRRSCAYVMNASFLCCQWEEHRQNGCSSVPVLYLIQSLIQPCTIFTGACELVDIRCFLWKLIQIYFANRYSIHNWIIISTVRFFFLKDNYALELQCRRMICAASTFLWKCGHYIQQGGSLAC